MGSRTYSFDAKLALSDGAAPYTANGPGLVAGAQKVIDFGGAPIRFDLGIVGGFARIDAACVIDVDALVTTNANNRYVIQIVGSNTLGSLAGGQVLGSMELGNTAALSSGAGTSTPGRYELLFSTEQADINYEFVGLYVVAQGTGASISFRAFAAVLPEE